ncbi:MAG: MFS transporter [Ignavibacteriae bacterium]|nr:MFS transporter [Ignavibacteriota bacterium]
MELWRKNLYILWGTQFLAMVGMNLVVPFLPFYVRQLGVTDPSEIARWSGLVFAGPFISAFLAIPFWGNLGDRYGRKIMVVRAIFGLALSQVLIGFAQDVTQLFVFRIFQGAISGFIASALALVSTNTPKDKIGYAMGVLQSSSAAGMVLGPLVGGVLADLIGYREIFLITAFLCIVGGVAVVTKVTEVSRVALDSRTYTVRQNYSFMLSNKQLRLVAITLVVGQASVLMIEPIFAIFIESFTPDTRFISTLAGSIFSIAGLFMIISAPWWGKRNDRKGYKKNLCFAMAATGVSYAGHLLVVDLFQLGALRALLGFARGGALPTLYSLTNIYAPPDRRGGIIAIASSLTILGNMIGPVIGGFVAGQFGITATFMVNSVMLVTMSVVLWRLLDESPHQDSQLSITRVETETSLMQSTGPKTPQTP